MQSKRQAIILLNKLLSQCFKESHKFANETKDSLSEDKMWYLLNEFDRAIAEGSLWVEESTIASLNKARAAFSLLVTHRIRNIDLRLTDWQKSKEYTEKAKRDLKRELTSVLSRTHSPTKRGINVSPTFAGGRHNVIINTAERDIDARKQHAGDTTLVNLPTEGGIIERSGLALGRLLMKHITLDTPKDLLTKIFPTAVFFLAVTGVSYSLFSNILLSAIPLVIAIIFFSALWQAYETRCEKCKKFFAMETVSKKHLRSAFLGSTAIHNIRQIRKCLFCKYIEDQEVIEEEDTNTYTPYSN